VRGDEFLNCWFCWLAMAVVEVATLVLFSAADEEVLESDTLGLGGYWANLVHRGHRRYIVLGVLVPGSAPVISGIDLTVQLFDFMRG
jgi:hypothetical protein